MVDAIKTEKWKMLRAYMPKLVAMLRWIDIHFLMNEKEKTFEQAFDELINTRPGHTFNYQTCYINYEKS